LQRVDDSHYILRLAANNRPQRRSYDETRRVIDAFAKRLWCKTSEMGEDGEMRDFVPAEELFAGRHFDAEIVVLCVRWYLSFELSYRDLVSMMNERRMVRKSDLLESSGAAELYRLAIMYCPCQFVSVNSLSNPVVRFKIAVT